MLIPGDFMLIKCNGNACSNVYSSAMFIQNDPMQCKYNIDVLSDLSTAILV